MLQNVFRSFWSVCCFMVVSDPLLAAGTLENNAELSDMELVIVGTKWDSVFQNRLKPVQKWIQQNTNKLLLVSVVGSKPPFQDKKDSALQDHMVRTAQVALWMANYLGKSTKDPRADFLISSMLANQEKSDQNTFRLVFRILSKADHAFLFKESEKDFLGIIPVQGEGGIVVSDICRKTKAYLSPLKKGDLITHVFQDRVMTISNFKSLLEQKLMSGTWLTVRRGEDILYITVSPSPKPEDSELRQWPCMAKAIDRHAKKNEEKKKTLADLPEIPKEDRGQRETSLREFNPCIQLAGKSVAIQGKGPAGDTQVCIEFREKEIRRTTIYENPIDGRVIKEGKWVKVDSRNCKAQLMIRSDYKTGLFTWDLPLVMEATDMSPVYFLDLFQSDKPPKILYPPGYSFAYASCN